MKKKYLYQGELMEEADVVDAAKQSNMDIDSYIKKAGIQVVDDDYSLGGEKYTAQEVLDAANESKLGFDDYIQKAGFEKKNQNGNGASNGHEQPVQEPAATTLPSQEESEPEQPAAEQPKVSVFDNPKLDALGAFEQGENGRPLAKTGFDVNIPSAPEKPKTLAPKDAVPDPAPLKSLYQDYQDHKPDIDRAMTTPVEGNLEFGRYVPNDSLFNDMVDPRNPSVTQLNKYSGKRQNDLEKEFQERKAALGKKYPDIQINQPRQQTIFYKPPEYYKELDALRAETDARLGHLLENVDKVTRAKWLNAELAKVAKPKFDMKEAGNFMRDARADPTLPTELRYERKGIDLTPSEKYYNDKVGYLAMQGALIDLKEKGVDIHNDPAAKQLYDHVVQGKKELFAKHKDFTHQQAVNAISDEIHRDKNALQLTTGGYTITDEDVQAAAKRLGIPDEIAKQVDDSEIKTSNIFGEFANELVMRPGANLGGFLERSVLTALGADKDAINARIADKTKTWTTILAEAPDAQSLFFKPTEISLDKDNDNFLEDVKSAKAGNFNWSVSAIGSTIGNGTGQMIQYGLGGNATGAALTGLNKLLKGASDIQKAKNVGLVTYGFLNAFESNYQKGRQLVGDDPAKETLRNTVASAGAFIEAISELIFPDYKVTDKLFGVKNAGSRQLLQMLAKAKAEDGAKVLASAVGKRSLAAVIKEGVVKTVGGTLKEIGEEEASLIGDWTIAALTNKKTLDNRNFGSEFIETAVQTFISALVPIGAGEFRQGSRVSPIKKSGVYEMGIDHKAVLSQINKDEADGKISTKLANRKGSIVNTMADIVKSTPDVSPLNGNNLTEKDKQDYAYNMLHSTMLGEKAAYEEKIGDVIQAAITKKQIKELADERELILAAADGIERNMNGEPLYERDNKAGVALKKAINLLPKNEDRIQLEKDKASENRGFDRQIAALDPESPTYEVEKNQIEKEREEANVHYDGEMAKATDVKALMGLDGEAAIKYIAQQAQNVQVDGSISDRQTFDDAYKAAVTAFGKELVDAAIEAHPVETLLVNPVDQSAEKVGTIDWSGQDNNFLANKEGFFTPEERVLYFEAMKKEDTKKVAAKMIKDRKEQLEKFATPPEPTTAEKVQEIERKRAHELALNKKVSEVNPELGKESEEELARQINEKFDKELKALSPETTSGKEEKIIPEKEEKIFRSQQEAENLMNEDLLEDKLDEEGKPVIKDGEVVKTPVMDRGAVVKKIPFKKKYGEEVKFTDVATGELITDKKTHEAMKILTDDFKSVNAFINC